jgi:hypothetical protein
LKIRIKLPSNLTAGASLKPSLRKRGLSIGDNTRACGSSSRSKRVRYVDKDVIEEVQGASGGKENAGDSQSADFSEVVVRGERGDGDPGQGKGKVCPRNGAEVKSRSRESLTEAAKTRLLQDSQGQALMEQIVMGTASDLETPETQAQIANICSILKGEQWKDKNAFNNDSLIHITQRVNRCLALRSALDFTTMVTLMQLAAKDVV